MSKSKLTVGLALFMLAALIYPATAQKTVAPTQAQTTRKNAAAGKPMTLNGIRETDLPNGLTVLTKEVHAAPVVYFAVYYNVGSVDEEVGQTGMSHLMEHMMFKGTKTRGPGVISATLQRNGAEFNANTSFDRTAYFETLASDRLELAMQIESDRMVNSVYNEQQHQKEMTVVRSEYEGDENNPGFVLQFAVRLAAYQVHPYRWDTIGFRSDIENFTRDEMYAYYKNYYTPNNATVIIVGDFSTAKALALVRKYFGALPAHPVLQHFITPEPPQQGERRVVIRRAGTTPQMEIAYHIPGFGNPDHYALDVLETVLSGGRTARFFQSMIQSGLASDAEAYDFGLRDPDLLFLDAVAQPGHTNAEMEAALEAEVKKVQTTPITDEELKRAIAQAGAGYIFNHDSVEQQGVDLGENAVKGDWRYGEYYLKNLRKVTQADVQRVANKYLVTENRTVGYFEPIVSAGGQPAPPPSIGGGATTTAVPRFHADPKHGRRYYHIAPKMARTALAAAPVSTAPRPTKVVLDNGLTVVVQENHANPTVSISGAILSAGGVFDPADKPGLAAFTAGQLSRGTQTRSLLDIARALEGVGASANVSGGEEYVSLGGRALSQDFETLLDVLSDELRHPAFPADELKKSQAQTLAGIAQAREDTGTLAAISLSDALFPPGHPYRSPTLDEQAAVVKSLSRDDLVNFYHAHYAPDKMILTIVGDVRTADAIAAIKKYFGSWASNPNLPPISIPNTPLPPGPVKAIVNPVPGKTQVDVFYGYPGQLKRASPDFYADVVVNQILGGGLASRLSDSVRDKMGLVYGIDAFDDASLGAGPFEVEFGSNPANVDKAVAEMNRQLVLLRDKGATPLEVSSAIAYLTGSYPVRLATNAGIAQQLLVAQVFGLGLDYIQKHNSFYKSMTVAQVNAAARKYLHPGVGALAIAGTYTGKYAARK